MKISTNDEKIIRVSIWINSIIFTFTDFNYYSDTIISY